MNLLLRSQGRNRDPTVYLNLIGSISERYLGKGARQKDPPPIAFGFCRHICPGINTTYPSIFIKIVLTLSVLNM